MLSLFSIRFRFTLHTFHVERESVHGRSRLPVQKVRVSSSDVTQTLVDIVTLITTRTRDLQSSIPLVCDRIVMRLQTVAAHRDQKTRVTPVRDRKHKRFVRGHDDVRILR